MPNYKRDPTHFLALQWLPGHHIALSVPLDLVLVLLPYSRHPDHVRLVDLQHLGVALSWKAI